MPPDYLDFDPSIAGRLVDTSIVDTEYASDPRNRDPRTPGRGYRGGSYLPSRTLVQRDGNLETRLRFPSLDGGQNGTFDADMAVRRQLELMGTRARSVADPGAAGLLLDDMGQLKSGYRGLKAAGWDPAEASQAALAVGGAFGSNADFANKAEYLRMLAEHRGTTMGAVAKQLGEQRMAFSRQYMADMGFNGGLRPSYLDEADADDTFAEAFSAVRNVEDRFDYVFDSSTVNGILKEVSRTAASLARRGMSASEYGMDKVVEAAMYKVGALTGGDVVTTPLGQLDAADEDDRRSLTWSDFEWDRQDPARQGEGSSYGRIQRGQSGSLDQDFSLTRGIRDAFAEHRVRNLRSGRAVDDWSDTELLKQGVVDALRSNSMSVKGLTDDDFGQLADAIIEKRMNGEKVSVTDTLRDMLFAPAPGQISSAERRAFSHNVSGKWGDSYTQYLAKLATGDFDPKLAGAEMRETVDQMLRTSGMTETSQDVVRKMTEGYLGHYRYTAQELRQSGEENPGKSKPLQMKRRLTQLAQAAQLVSLIDVCKQARVITEKDAENLIGRFYDPKKPGEINLGVLQTVEAGAFHNATRDTLQTWLLETSRNGNFSGEGKPSNWRFASETRVREIGADPLEYTFRFLKDRLDDNNTVGVSDVRQVVDGTVRAMDALRRVYDNIEKDSNGNLKNSHVLTGDPDTARLFTREDVSIGWRGFIPFWKKDNRYEFDRGMRDFDRAMDDLRATGQGFVVPGMEESGYDETYMKTRLVGRWDNTAEATIDSGKSLGGRVLAGVDPAKAEAWSEWTENQTMNTANAREAVERVTQGLLRSAMAKFPGVSENDPRYRQALQNAYRFVKGKMVEGEAIRGIDDVVAIGDDLLERAALLNTRPNTDRGGQRAFGGDFQLMQEMQGILAPLQEASQREYTQARQTEEQQAAILRAQMEADSARRAGTPPGEEQLPQDVQERVNREEQKLGRPLTQQELDAIVRGG